MAPGPFSTDPVAAPSAATAAMAAVLAGHGPALIALAAASIRHGLSSGAALIPPVDSLAAPLRQPGASFVTLKHGGALRGCIGSVEAVRPLGQDVAANGFAAAFRDPRFPPLAEPELTGLTLSVAVLTAPEPIAFADEAALRAGLRPGQDGLILAEGPRRALFLPAVWEQLPDPALFLAHLKRKGGLEGRAPLQAWRFETLSVAADDPRALWGAAPAP